jgi:hypothetical protein
MTHNFVILGRRTHSVQANLTLVCKTDSVVRKFLKFRTENEH